MVPISRTLSRPESTSAGPTEEDTRGRCDFCLGLSTEARIRTVTEILSLLSTEFISKLTFIPYKMGTNM